MRTETSVAQADPPAGTLASSRADFSSRLGRKDEARLAYLEALMLSENETERTFLAGRLHQLEDR